MTRASAPIKSGKASLIGGIVVGLACFALWFAIAHDAGIDGPLSLGIGAIVAAGIGAWIRIADL
jgi:protein-S-isoprenylcysteine O-methyltransferase Ste14